MNKFIIVGIILVIIIGAGVVYGSKTNTNTCAPGMGIDRDLKVVSKRLEWRFEPETITIQKCDRVHVKVSNEDNFDHGFAIEALGISKRLPANGSIDVDFVALTTGKFPFYCSVSCSTSEDSTFKLKNGKVETGPYAGKVRGHFDQLGTFLVEEIKKIIN